MKLSVPMIILALGIHACAAADPLDPAIDAMCGKSIVLIGEATHGGGNTATTKVELVKRLVSQCGFNALLFESSYYEFVPINRLVQDRQPVSPRQLADAVGGLWKFSEEVAPLFPFLAEQVNDHALQLGGMDFQASGLQQPYSNQLMFAELTAPLADDRRAFCRALYRARIFDDDDLKGFGALPPCLDDMARVADPAQERQITNLWAWIATDGHPQQEMIRARDAMMADNAMYFIDHARTKTKTIIWTHNGHAARDTRLLSDYGASDNLGQALSRRYGGQMFSLALSAYAGEYRWSSGINKPVPPPPADSLEAKFGQPGQVTFVRHAALQQAGAASSAVFGYAYQRADWSRAFDGLLILNVEMPTHDQRDQPVQHICVEAIRPPSVR